MTAQEEHLKALSLSGLSLKPSITKVAEEKMMSFPWFVAGDWQNWELMPPFTASIFQALTSPLLPFGSNAMLSQMFDFNRSSRAGKGVKIGQQRQRRNKNSLLPLSLLRYITQYMYMYMFSTGK